MLCSYYCSSSFIPVSPAPELVCGGAVVVELDGAIAVPDARVGLLQLEVARAPLGEGHGRVGIDLDGLRELGKEQALNKYL